MSIKISNETLLKKIAITIAENPRYTLNELAKAIGISKASLHRNYGTRESLQQLLENETQKCIELIIDTAKKKHSNFNIAIQELMQIHLDNKEFLVFARESQLCINNNDAIRYITMMDEFFLEGKKQGFFKLEIEVATLTELFISIFTGITNAERIGRIPTTQLLKTFKNSFLFGVMEES